MQDIFLRSELEDLISVGCGLQGKGAEKHIPLRHIFSLETFPLMKLYWFLEISQIRFQETKLVLGTYFSPHKSISYTPFTV